MAIKLHWYTGRRNMGDMISPVIVEHFTGENVEFASPPERGKMLAVGSIIQHAKEGDTVWGTGLIEDTKMDVKSKILALRGPLTADRIGSDCKIFGDPGILLPIIYNPEIEKKHKMGIIKHLNHNDFPIEGHPIDIRSDWKEVVNEIKSCEVIASSSLHGIITAEAYGIPAIWIDHNSVEGKGFKFRDYYASTNREAISGKLQEIPNFEKMRNDIILALQ